ncbi:MAG: hypothetical protein AAB606_03275 [Patescibacteria group bacterium]
MFRKNLTTFAIFISIAFTAVMPAHAQLIENLQFFGSEPAAGETDKGRSLANCLSGLGQFLSAMIGYEDFTDYWRDFYIGFRWPMYYADIANVESQVNKARYGVVAAFLRCDLNRLKSVTNAYYRLEGELYFVRHFIDASGGFVRNRADATNDKNNFMNEMMDYFTLRVPSSNPDQDRALYSGYFDMFASKYRARAAQYASYGADPVWSELSAKFEQLLDTFKGFQKLGSELGQLGKEVGQIPVDIGSSLKKAAVDFYNNPDKSVTEALLNITSRFKICPSPGSPDDCRTLGNGMFGVFELDTGEKKTFEQVQTEIDTHNLQIAERDDKADMLQKYEVLYGQAGGSGSEAVVSKMDKLLAILGVGRPANAASGEKAVPGSLQPLELLGKCAYHVQNNMCK